MRIIYIHHLFLLIHFTFSLHAFPMILILELIKFPCIQFCANNAFNNKKNVIIVEDCLYLSHLNILDLLKFTIHITWRFLRFVTTWSNNERIDLKYWKIIVKVQCKIDQRRVKNKFMYILSMVTNSMFCKGATL
jgi:hypothetical protein